MLNQMSHNWWLVVLRGLIAIAFAVLGFLAPTLAGLVLISLFGAYAFVDGIFALVAGIAHARSNRHWWLLVLEGILGILVGIIVFFRPGISALFLGILIAYWIAAWAVVTGVLEIIAAFRLRQEVANEVWLIIGGILSIVLGVVLFIVNPLVAATSTLYAILFYALLFGISQLILGIRMHSMAGHVPEPSPCATEPC